MDNTLLFSLLSVLFGVIIGFVIAKVLEKNNASKLIKNAKKSASGILKSANKDADALKKDKILQAKEKFIELKAEHEKVISAKDKKMADAEKRTRDKESQVSSELAKNTKLNRELESKSQSYEDKLFTLERKQSEVDRLHKSQVEQLEVISSLSADEAKAQLMESLKTEAKTEAMAYVCLLYTSPSPRDS